MGKLQWKEGVSSPYKQETLKIFFHPLSKIFYTVNKMKMQRWNMPPI